MNNKTLLDYPVYVINLDRRKDRWESVRNILNKSNFFNVYRISAIDGKKIDTNQIKKLVHPDAYKKIGKIRERDEDLGSLGAIGCYLSHYKAWLKIVESGKPGIIAEDDMVLDTNLINFDAVKNPSTLDEYDMTLLGYCNLRERNSNNIITQPGLYPYKGMFFCLHFYYLTPQGAEKFISKSFPIEYQVDSYMSYLIKRDIVTCAFHYPLLSWQTDMGTDIQTPKHEMEINRDLLFFFCIIAIILVLIFLIVKNCKKE